MASNRILIPGLGIANAMGLDCACNLSYGELIVNPSTILWVDRICLPKKFLEPKSLEDSYEDYVVKSIFEALNDCDLLETIAGQELKTSGRMLPGLAKIVDAEFEDMMVASPNRARKGSGLFLDLDDSQYCSPYIVAGYASQILARRIGAKCLVDRGFARYLRTKRDILATVIPGGGEKTISLYNEIFSVVVANDATFPNILFTKRDLCAKCARHNKCEGNFKTDVKNVIRRLLDLRDSDSFCLLRNEIDSIVRLCSDAKDISASYVIDELREKARKIYKFQKKEFPKIERWTNLAMMIALPSAYLANSCDALGSLAVSGAVIAGAKLIDKYLEYKSNIWSWTDFLNKRTSIRENC